MKNTSLAVLLLSSSPALAQAPDTGAPLWLGVGEQRILWVENLSRFSLGSDEVRVRPLPTGFEDPRGEALMLKGVRKGSTDLWIFRNGEPPLKRMIHVRPWKATLPQALTQAMAGLQEAEVIPTGKGVLLRGQVRSLKEAGLIDALERHHPKVVLNQTQPSEELISNLLTQVEAWLKDQDLDLRVERLGGRLWLRGVMDPDKQEGFVESLPFPYLKTELSQAKSQSLSFRIYLLELRNEEFENLGLRWPTEVSGQLQTQPLGLIKPKLLDLKLEALEREGSARVLSNPELLVRAPGKATLFAGGQLPIQQVSRYGSKLHWKNFGLSLELEVQKVKGQEVLAQVQTEVSHLDSQIGTDQIPGIQVNRIHTQINARFGQPVMLCGLFQEDLRKQARGLPELHKLPVLGSLFGSNDYQESRSEFVAILIPHSQAPAGAREALSKHWSEEHPLGPVPPPRNWMSPSQIREAKNHPEYPWNVL